MNHLGVFAGIGGFELAARWMGWNTLAWCEWDKPCQKILRHHFPKAKEHHDITKTDFTPYANQVDVFTGGFPCQPYSNAGKRKGNKDDRHLWPEMLRAIREIQPTNVVGENVRGLTNWSGGLVFEQVQADLEAEGYEVLPFLLPACSVNAPHRRDRIWFIAHSDKFGQQRRIKRLSEMPGQGYDTEDMYSGTLGFSRFGNDIPAPRIFRASDGLPGGVDRLKQLGNAIVPQVALQIYKAIQAYEDLK